jgi:hypothetical protein
VDWGFGLVSVDGAGVSRCVWGCFSVFRVWVLAGFLSEFAVLVGGLLLYWTCQGVESATVTTMGGGTFLDQAECTRKGGKTDI